MPTLYKPHGFFGLSCPILTNFFKLLMRHNHVAKTKKKIESMVFNQVLLTLMEQ